MNFLYSPLAILAYLVIFGFAASGYRRNGWDGVADALAELFTPKPKAPKPVAAEPAPAAVVTIAGPRKTTYRQKYQTSHGGHAVGTIITGGLWLPAWAVFTVANKLHPGRKVTERHHY